MAQLGVITKQPGEALVYAVDYSLVFGNAAGLLSSAVVTAAAGISVAQGIASPSLNLTLTGGATGTDYAVTIVAQVVIEGVPQTIEDEFTVRVLEVVPSLLAPLAVQTWMAWAAELAPKMPDALVPSIIGALKEATQDHFRKTRAYRLNGLSAGLTVAAQPVYVVALPSGLELVGVPQAKVGKDDAEEIDALASVDLPEVGDDLDAWRVAVDGANSIRLWPTPTTPGAAITLNVAVMPDLTLEGIDRNLYRVHREAIEAAALADLYADKTKPWSDPAMAQELQRQAARDRLLHSTRAGPRSARMRLRSEPT